MESSTLRLCSNCEHRHISTPTVTWCPDCDEAFCSECIVHHDALKIAKFHKTISLTQFDKLPPFIKETSVYCTDHDQKCDFYCSSHQHSCCNVCLKESHFQCEKLEILQDIVKNVKTSTVLEDIENDLKCLMTNLDSLLQNRIENKTRINDQKFACIEEIQIIRKLVNDKLDNMEKSLKDTLQSNVEEVVSDLDNLLQELDIHKSGINTLQKELETGLSIATDLQVFLGLRPLELRLEEEHAYLETLKTNKAMDEVDIVLDSSSTVSTLVESGESFGVISQARKRNNSELGIRKKEQAQLLLPSKNKLSNIEFSQIAQFKIPTGKNGISTLGCVVMPEKMLVFTDGENNRLIIVECDGTFLRDIFISFSPRYITYIDSSTVVVTCSLSKKVVLIELNTGNLLSSFSTDEMCFGLSFLNETLTIRMTGSFVRMTRGGQIKTKFKADCKAHCCATDDYIISSNTQNNSVLSFKMNGDLAWQFKDPNLQHPGGVTVIEDGFVLATGEKSNNLFVISPDGQSGREILNDLDKPYAIHFDKASKLMVIVSRTGSAKVFQKKRDLTK